MQEPKEQEHVCKDLQQAENEEPNISSLHVLQEEQHVQDDLQVSNDGCSYNLHFQPDGLNEENVNCFENKGSFNLKFDPMLIESNIQEVSIPEICYDKIPSCQIDEGSFFSNYPFEFQDENMVEIEEVKRLQ